MPIEQAATLFPDNGTTIDSGGGVDIRRLNAANPGPASANQSVAFTHANDNAERTFDPVNNNVSTDADAHTLIRTGYALRLAEDMTPADDTNCDAFLLAQSVTLTVQTQAEATGSYLAGTYTPTMKASLWQYDPATNAGTLIATGSDDSVSWTVGALGDIGTLKVSTITMAIAEPVQFDQGKTLLLQIGLNTGTVPNPTLGTGNWTHRLRVGDATNQTRIDFADRGVRTLCPTQGVAAGDSAAFANAAQIKPTAGVAQGSAVALGVAGATKGTVGVAQGAGNALGQLAAVKGTVGVSQGAGEALGQIAAVKGTVGTVNVGEGGGDVVIQETRIFAVLD